MRTKEQKILAQLYPFSDEIKKMGFPAFAKMYWRVSNKLRNMVPFVLQPPQIVIWAAIQKQMDAGLPVRIRILKARQQGVSLFSQMFFLWWTLSHPSHLSISIANRLELPKRWVQHLRRLMRQIKKQRTDTPMPSVNRSTELIFDDIEGSGYIIGTSLGVTPGMGETINCIHGSEVASWVDPDAILSDLLPAMPPTNETMIIQESTGRAMGDWWYQRYMECQNPDCEYDSIFLPWYLSPEYNQDVIEGRTGSKKYKWEDLEPLDNRESATLMYAERYQRVIRLLYRMPDLTPGQMMWRRKMIVGHFHGDVNAFANQYPACENEAFLSAGLNVFTQEQVKEAQKTIREPDGAYDITFPTWHPRSMRLLVNDESGELKVWKHEAPNGEMVEKDDRYHYVIGADCQWGEANTADFDVLYVKCLELNKIVAKVKGRYDLSSWGKIIAAVGWHYNTAMVAPERNAKAATSVMALLLGDAAQWSYPNIFVRSDQISLKGHRPQDYGWYTNHDTKNNLLAYTKTTTLERTDIDDPRSPPVFDWCDEEAVEQMQAYIKDEKNKFTAPVGAHDDDLMAMMITHYVSHNAKPNIELYIKKTQRVQLVDFTPPEARLQWMAERDSEDYEEIETEDFGDIHEYDREYEDIWI